jgi:hypothetical protein
VRREAGSYPVHSHCFCPWLDQMVVDERLPHSSFLLGNMNRGKSGVLSFTDLFWFWQVVGLWILFPPRILESDRLAPPGVSADIHVCLSVRSPWFNNCKRLKANLNYRKNTPH